MSYQNLSVSFSSEEKTNVINQINAVKSALYFMINLTPVERKKLRKVAEKRQGYVNDVMMAVKANPSCIPPVINTEEYFKDAQLFLDFSEIYAQMITLFEGISDTFMASGNETITTTDHCYGFLKQAAKGNSNLSTTVNEISKHFSKRGKARTVSSSQ